MMNNQIFASIVAGLTNLDDVQGAQILAIVNGYASMAPAAVSKAAPAPKAKKPFKGEAKDVTVTFKVAKNVVTIDGYVGRDVWTVLRDRFTAAAGTYDKDSKSIMFPTQKAAAAFAKNNVVTADERKAVWDSWSK